MRSRAVLWIFLVPALTGAKSEGCATEYQPGDGSSEQWSLGDIPEKRGPDKPMTCAWLESNNCWKDLVAEARDCLSEREGQFSEDRDECRFADGARLELAGPIGEPAKNSTLFPIVDHRVLDAAGHACHTSRILGVGRVAHAVGSGTVVFENLNLTQYRVTCPDGSSYSNAVEGTCASFGLKWLAKSTPGYTLTCSGESERCDGTFWGASKDGPARFFSCADEER